MNKLTPEEIEEVNARLRICPFCGSKVSVVNVKSGLKGEQWAYSVRCFKCRIKARPFQDIDSLVEAWNRRVWAKE